jgi:hypothetical protein
VTGAPAAPAMVLACLVEPGSTAEAKWDWADLMAPEVSLRRVQADVESIAGVMPYALLGSGPLGVAAFELAGRLSAAGRGPSRLLVFECPPPVELPPLSCPIVAFAGPARADEMAEWRGAGTAGFTLRLLGEVEAADIALALKEELQVWPY